MSQKIIIYGHAFCPNVGPVKRLFHQSGVAYDYINIHKDNAGRQRVQEINNGYESVPTLEFPDGSTLTEPSTGDLKRKLESLGYTVPIKALLASNLQSFVMIAFIVVLVFKAIGVI